MIMRMVVAMVLVWYVMMMVTMIACPLNLFISSSRVPTIEYAVCVGPRHDHCVGQPATPGLCVGQPTSSSTKPAPMAGELPNEGSCEETLRQHWDEPLKKLGIPASWQLADKAAELDERLQTLAGKVADLAPVGAPATAPEVVGEPTKEEEALKKAIDDGKMDARSALGQQFYRELKINAKLKAEFEATGKTRNAQREFRLQWGRAKYEVLRNSRTKKEETWDLSSMDAEYCCFSRIWKREGGDAPAFETAKKFVRSAVKLWSHGETFNGHPWVKFDKIKCGAQRWSATTGSGCPTATRRRGP